MARKEVAPRVVIAHARGDATLHDALATALGGTSPRVVDDAGTSSGDTLVVLVTPRLLASDWPWSEELAGWLARHAEGKAHVVPVAGRRVSWAGTPLAGLPSAASVPLDAWGDLAEAAKDAADEVRAVIAAPASSGAPAAEPVPTWSDEGSRRLGERLHALYAWRAVEPGDAVDAAIMSTRAQLRRGPMLRGGEFLGDGRWRLLAPIGHGATDTLWRAYDRATGATAAVKVFHGAWVVSDDAVARFLHGARRLAALEHTAVARILDTGTDDGFVWVAVEQPEGGTLRDAILQGRLRGTPALQALIEVARALEYAHARGFVHGQVHPGNVRLTADGAAQLVDFAQVRDPSEAGKATVYDPPEALEASWAPDPVGDGYSLAMTAMFALHGAELPFWVLRDPGRLLDALPVVDPVRRVLRRATTWERDARFPSVASLVQALLDDAAIVRALADSARRLGRLAVATEHYESLLAASAPSDADMGEDVELQTILGELYLRMERPDEAYGHIVGALGIATDLEPLFPMLRNVAQRTGDWERVATALEGEWAGRGASDRAAVAAELATIYQENLRDPVRASRSWARVLDDHRRPEEALRALRALADIARASEDWDAFIAWSRDLLAHLPSDERPPVQHAIGETFLLRKHDEQNGLLWIDRASAGGFRSMGIAKALEEIRARRGEWPQAIALMRAQAAEQTAAQAVRTLLRAAHIARSVHLEEEAAEIWATLLERVPGHHLALRNLARMQFRAGRHAAALPLYEQLCSVVDGKPAEEPEASERACDNVSCARLLLGVNREADALARLEEALRLNPGHAPALHFAGPLHMGRGETARARTVYERLLQTFRTEDRIDAQTEACLGLGEVDWTEGKLADAAAWYLRAVEFDRTKVAAWWGLAKVALAARGGHPGGDRAPWLRAAPQGFTPHEALARLLAGVLDPSAASKWLATDALGAAVLVGGETGARAMCAIVDRLLRHKLVGPELFARLAQIEGWERQVEAVRHLWFEPADTDDSFPVYTSYAWARRHIQEDFDASGARPVLQATAPVGATGEARFDVLFAGKPPPAPDQAAVPPEPVGKEAGPVAPIVGLVETPWLRLALLRDQEAAVIGSSPSATCTIAREGIAGEHALLFRAGPHVYVRALDGETLLDGEPIEARRLVGSEEIALGTVRLRVRFAERAEQLPGAEPKAAAKARTPVVEEPPTDPIPAEIVPPRPLPPSAENAAPQSDYNDAESEVTESLPSASSPDLEVTQAVAVVVQDFDSEDEVTPGPEPVVAPIPGPEPAPEPVAAAIPAPEPAPEPIPEALPAEPTVEQATAVEERPAWVTAEEEEEPLPSLVAPPPIVVPRPRGPTPMPAPVRESAPVTAPAKPAKAPKAARAATPPAPAPAPPAPAAPTKTREGLLQGLSGPAKGLQGRFEQMLTVGRSKACDMRIAGDNKLSGTHFRIERRDEGFILVDVDSSNGTVVNGARVKEAILAGGETIMAGKSVLVFKVTEPVSA